MSGKIRVVATRSMVDYAGRVCEALKGFSSHKELHSLEPFDNGLQVTRFADGEMEVELKWSARGDSVYLFAGAARNPLSLSVEQNKIETYHAVDVLRRAQVGKITLFEPYITAGRSDRTTRRNSVGLWVHLKTLIALGVNHIITYNLHSDMSTTMVDPAGCALDNVPAHALLKKHILRYYVKSEDRLESLVRRQWLFSSVDAGGETLAKRFATAFGTAMLVAHKQRDYSQANCVESTELLTSTSLQGKTIWIVDDILDTGGSIQALMQELEKRGVAAVNLAVIHPVLSPPAMDRLSEMARSGLLQRIITTDTIPLPRDLPAGSPVFEVVSSARLSAEIIHRLHNDLSLSQLLSPFDPRQYFRELKESLPVDA